MARPDPITVALERELLETLIKGYKVIADKLAQPRDDTTIPFIEGVVSTALIVAGEQKGGG